MTNTTTESIFLPQGQTLEHMPIKVSCGPTEHEFEMPIGITVESVATNPYYREIVGFKGNETSVVNGQPVARDYVLSPGDRVEMMKEAGEKA